MTWKDFVAHVEHEMARCGLPEETQVGIIDVQMWPASDNHPYPSSVFVGTVPGPDGARVVNVTNAMLLAAGGASI